MKILIIYGTVEGQTRKIARFMEEVLQNDKHQVAIADATEEPPTPSEFDMVIIGSSIHIHEYNKAVKEYVKMHVETLNTMPTAFYSVCLAVASDIPEEHEEAASIAKSFLEETNWTTQTIWHFAGALKYTKYDYFKRLIMRMIAKKEGASQDTKNDHEYTNWDEVEKSVMDFVVPETE